MGVKTRNLGNSEGKDIQWQQPLNADGSTIFNVEAGKGYFINTTGGEVELKLPTGSLGDRIAIMDFGGTFDTNCVRINLNGQKLNGSTNPSGVSGSQNYVKIDTQNARLELVFSDSDKGWVVTESEAKTSPTTAPFAAFIEATGGTVTTSGNFKIHSFTGDGCFIVSNAGNAGGANKVSYVVVAGGGGGAGNQGNADGSSGAGAGGYREGRAPSFDTYTASPLVAPDGLEVPVATYPITVGGGGTAGAGAAAGHGGKGSNSVFSTITSTGGGGGQHPTPPYAPISKCGGSGAGAAASGNPSANQVGAGNTPPVSPPQGNNGGNYQSDGQSAAGGGGGAGAVGGNAPGNTVGGDGGAGVASCITASPVQRAGGGAGSAYPANTGGSGGAGGGGDGGRAPGFPSPAGEAGTANTGGGGGGANANPGNPNPGGAGGKGVVIIRYKFQ